jgi:hypothetical protein
MYKIKIIKNEIKTHGASFESIELANAWLDEGKNAEWWGKSEQIELDLDGVPTGNIIPAEYTVVIEDITAQLEKEKALEKSKLALALGADLVAEIRLININKNMSAEVYLALIQDQSLAAIERLLWVGSFETAKAFIQSYDGPFYTSEEKLSIITLIDSAIEKVV